MLQLYDKNKNKIKGLTKYKDFCIESVLKTGDKTLSFLYLSKFIDGIVEEGYIRNKTDEFVIKEIADHGEWTSIKAQMNVEDLEGKAWEHFNTTEQTIENCLNLACAGTGWTVQVNNVSKKRTVKKTNCSSWDLIQEAKKIYRVEIEFDTLNKVVKVYEKLGQDKGVYFSDEINLKALDIESNSYDFYTKIIAIGKENIKVEVENFQYSNKVKTLIWKDERYTVLENLREDAIAKLQELSKPRKSYSADVIDLANLNPKYKNILDYKLGDTITLISKDKKIREKQRIVKITDYPDEAERNSCEIANTTLDFIDIQKEFQDTADTVNNITEDNGTVSQEAIKVAVKSLVIDKADIGSLNAAVARIGSLETTKANITDLTAINANISNLQANKANITDLTATNIKFDVAEGGTLSLQTLLSKFITGENGQFLNLTTDNVVIANAVIKDTIAANISVQDLKAGNIDANRFNIVGTNGNLLIKDNTIQIKDSTRVRVQIGKDASNDYSMYVWDATGKLMFDATGLKADGIKSKIIRDDMVSDTANISGSKINISSLITEVNKDTNTQLIKASKVAVDLTGQSLEVSFNSLKSNVDNMEIGGRNFIKDSDFLVEATSSNGAQTKSVALVSGLNLTETFLGKTVIFSYFVNCPGSRLHNESQGALGNRFGIHGAVTWGDSTGKLSNKGGIYPFAECLTGEYENTRVIMSYKFTPPSGYDTIASFSFSFQPYARPTNDNNSVWKIGQPKLEIGTKATGYTEAPEDVEQKIETNTTAITVAQGQISGLISESSITKGDVITLKDNYTSIKATVDGINTTVASHTSSITNLGTNLTNAQNTANSANSLADSKAKVFTSTPTTPYKIGDIWTGGPYGEIMKCKVARSTGGYVAADWEKASKYTDDTKAVAVEGKVTIVETKQATLEQNLEGFKTTVSSTYATQTDLSTANGNISSLETRIKDAELKITSDAIVSTVRSSTAYTTDLNAKANQSALNTTNSNVSGLTTRINTVEQSITATAITTTISSAINAGTSSITTTQFVMDKTGFTVKNGAIKIQNKTGTNVMTSDTNGNLTITGTFVNKNYNGVDAIKIQDTSIYFYDWERNGRNLGIIYSSYNSAYPNVRGFSLGHSKLGYMTIGYESATNTYNQYITFDKYSINPSYTAPIRVHESAVFNSAVNMQDRVYIPNTMYFGSSSASTTSQIWGSDVNNRLAIQVSVNAANDGFMIQTNTGGVLFSILAGRNYPILLNNNVEIRGNYTATGSKNSLQSTDHYGERLINAYETAEYYFGDIGSGTIKDGECIVWIDDILQECINTNVEYHVFTQVYEGKINKIERYNNYFIVYGEDI